MSAIPGSVQNTAGIPQPHLNDQAGAVESSNAPAQTEAEKKAQFEKLLSALEEQMQKEQAIQSGDFEIPKDLEHLFKAPLNKDLIERDFNIWSRVVRIGSFILGQNAIVSRGINASTAILGGAVGICLTQYPRIFMGGAALIGGGYYGLKNVASIFFGSTSWKERTTAFRQASLEPTSSAAFAKRFSALIGTTSISQRTINLFKGALQGYIAKLGHDILFNITEDYWTRLPVQGLGMAQTWAFPLLAMLIGGGIGFLGMMTNMHFYHEGLRKISPEITGFKEDMKYSGEYDRLLYISDEEYKADLAQAMGLSDYAQLAQLREGYRAKIIEEIERRKYPGHEQILIDAKKDLEKIDQENPDAALKAIVAQLILLKQEKVKILETYEALIKQNHLPKAHRFLNEEVKPILLKVEFLKQSIIDPARPQMGMLPPQGNAYYSYLAVLLGRELKYDLKSQDPKILQLEMENILVDEAAVQKMVFHARGKEFLLQQQRTQRSMQNDAVKA